MHYAPLHIKETPCTTLRYTQDVGAGAGIHVAKLFIGFFNSMSSFEAYVGSSSEISELKGVESVADDRRHAVMCEHGGVIGSVEVFG